MTSRSALASLALFAPLLLARCDCGTTAAIPCDTNSDCPTGQQCGADGLCAPASVGEGEGDVGEGEGEGDVGEGEGEPGCGDGVVQTGEACDDGNVNDNDACSSACNSTSVSVARLLGDDGLRSLPVRLPGPVWSAPGPNGTFFRGVVVASMFLSTFWQPPGDDRFVRIDDVRALSRDAAELDAFAFASQFGMALGPDQRLYASIGVDGQQQEQIQAFDLLTGEVEVIAGSDTPIADFDPPGFVFADPFSFSFRSALGLDVDNDGTVYFSDPDSDRLFAVDPLTHTARVLAGSVAAGHTDGTPAQNTVFANILDVAVEHDAAGTPIGVWFTGTTNNLDPFPRRVDLATGELLTLSGSGTACDGGAPIAGCQVKADKVAVDGEGGIYTYQIVLSGPTQGVLHIDAARNVTTVGTKSLGLVTDFGVVAPGVVAATSLFFDNLLVVNTDGSVEEVGDPIPARGTDRTVLLLSTATTSDSEVLVASFHEVLGVDRAGNARTAFSLFTPGPCQQASESGFVDGLAATPDGTKIFFSQTRFDRICVFDTLTGVESVFLDSTSGFFNPKSIAVYGDELLAEVTIGDVSPDQDNVYAFPLSGGGAAVPIAEFPPQAEGMGISVHNDIATLVWSESGSVFWQTVGPAPSHVSANLNIVPALPFAVAPDATGATVVAFDAARPQLARFASDGTSTPIAGSAVVGYFDGAAASARFSANAAVLPFGDDIAIIDAGASTVRILEDGQVRTLLGSDQFSEDGPFSQSARLARPVALGCGGTRCVVADVGTLTLRQLDLATSRLARVHGRDGARLTGLTAALQHDDDVAYYAAGSQLHEVDLPSGTDTVFAQGQFVGAPTLLADPQDGNLIFFDGASSLKQAGPTLRTLGAVPSAPVALGVDVPQRRLYVALADEVRRLDLDAADPPAQQTVLPLPAGATRFTALAIDRFGNLFVATDVEIREHAVAADGSVDAAGRVAATIGDPVLPIEGCMVAGSGVGDDVLFADRCTGSVLRVSVDEVP